MLILSFIFNKQVLLGMLLGACLFVPWNQRRTYFGPRLVLSVAALIAASSFIASVSAPTWAGLLLNTLLIYLQILFCFDCSMLHAVFYTTCAYAVQHITSKLVYMVVFWLREIQGSINLYVVLSLLLLCNILVGLPIYFLFTRHFRHGQLLFDNVKTVLYSGLFLIAAVYLSVVLENVLDTASDSYLTAYFALNTFCVLFAVTVLALEFSNCSIKHLEHENMVLEQLLECDRQQYEQAQKDMEKINIRYHDLKQQYSRATEEERAKLETEMENLNLRYFTGNKALDISRCRDMTVIRVENYTPAAPVQHCGTLVTTKQDAAEHGYGMKSIKSIAEHYGGTADYFVEDNIFYLVVTLPFFETAS